MKVSLCFVGFVVGLGFLAQAEENPFQGYYWVRGLEVPARYWDPYRDEDPLAGPRWDGGLLVNPLVCEERIFFYDKEYDEWHFFWLSDLVGDPRQTDWWEKSRQNCQAPTLWSRVAEAARSQDHPNVTKAIINDMIASGVVSVAELEQRKMTTERLSEIMLQYSQLVWD